MTIDVTMPSTAPTMSHARLGQWLRQIGDAVRAGEPIAEIESEKSVTELESPADGFLVEILVPANTDDVAVGALLARIGERPLPARSESPGATPASFGTPVPATEPAEASPAAATVAVDPVVATAVPATPLATRVARLLDVDLAAVTGSGAEGRVTLQDLPLPAIHASRETPARGASAAGPAQRLIPHTAHRRVTARRLSEAKQRIPHFYLNTRVCVDRLLDLRAEINAAAGDGSAPRVSVNDCVVRAVALALGRLPEVNVTWSEEGLLQNPAVDVAVAVAGPAGLVTPVLHGADAMRLRELAARTRDLAERARSGTLTPDEYQGGCCTVSNLGMFGIDGLYAIVNPPQPFIVGVGRVTEEALVQDGRLVAGRTLQCTLSGDHRAIDGASGARLLATVRDLLEQPLHLLL